MSTAPDEFDSVNAYDAARAESDLAFIAKKRREIEWWQHNIAAAEEKIARAEERLKAFAIAYRQTVGGSQISLANGFVAISKQRERTEIYDREAWRKWMHSREWHEDFYDKVLSESKVKSNIYPDESGDFLFTTGEYAEKDGTTLPVLGIVPGIRRVKPGPLDFNVKINAGRTYHPGVTTWDEQTSDGRTIPGHHDTEENEDAEQGE